MEPSNTENIFIELNLVIKYDKETNQVLFAGIQKEYHNGPKCNIARDQLGFWINHLIEAAKGVKL